MKKFTFRLQHLLNLREQEEELWKLRLGEAAKRIAEIDQAIEFTHTAEREALGQYRNPRDMYAAQYYMIRMRKERERLVVEREAAEKKRLEILKDFTLARQKAEVLRKLREKHFDLWRKEYLEYQDSQIDDLAASRRILQTGTLVGV